MNMNRMTLSEAAAHLGRSTGYLRQAIRRGKLKASGRFGQALAFTIEDLEAYRASVRPYTKKATP